MLVACVCIFWWVWVQYPFGTCSWPAVISPTGESGHYCELTVVCIMHFL